jgi:hypothetical protein
VTSDHEDEEPVAGPAPKIKVEMESLTPPGPTKSQTPASSPSLASPNAGDIITKELKLVKPQDLLQEPPGTYVIKLFMSVIY